MQLGRNIICLHYVIQIQYYPSIIGTLHDVLLKYDTFFHRVTEHDTNGVLGRRSFRLF